MVFRQQRALAWPLFITLLSCVNTASAAMNAMTYKGCFSSSQPLTDEGPAQYQTSGLCQTNCVGRNNAVLGLSNGTNCWCGDQLPPASSLTDDSKCSTPCNGYGSDKCKRLLQFDTSIDDANNIKGGASSYWSVYLTGTKSDVTNYGDDSSSGGSTTSSASSSSPSVVTSVSPGKTVVVTTVPSSTAPAGNGGGSNTAGIAAGVVVGVVGAAALIGGVFFFLRRRRRQQAEADYKHSAQVQDFMRGGERKAPNTGYSQMSDSRLDPEIGRRNSVGSMADEQDYSRRILRVANPDSH